MKLIRVGITFTGWPLLGPYAIHTVVWGKVLSYIVVSQPALRIAGAIRSALR